ncbi:MAG: hypothetical protein NC218_06795 [Acetobacter sp.]|nr:hypothetical protein [Acetobacter sp.]
MKKCSILLVGALAMLVASCGFKSEEKPLTGNLVTYTAEGTKKGEVLLGVKDKTGKKDKEIIPAAAYTSITADNNCITCARPDAATDVYTLTGEPVGPKTYATFEQQTNADNIYYVGKAEETTYYFFPGQPLVSSTLSYMTAKNLFVEKENLWQIYTFDGKMSWVFPTDALILKSKRTEEAIVVIPKVKGKVTTGTVYTSTGKELKKLNAVKYRKLVKKLKEPTKIGSMNLYEVESLEVDKL